MNLMKKLFIISVLASLFSVGSSWAMLVEEQHFGFQQQGPKKELFPTEISTKPSIPEDKLRKIIDSLKQYQISDEQFRQISNASAPPWNGAGKRTRSDDYSFSDKSNAEEEEEEGEVSKEYLSEIEQLQDPEKLLTITYSKPIIQDESTTIATSSITEATLTTSGNVTISPIKPKAEGGPGRQIREFAIYGMIAYMSGDDGHIPSHDKRINFGTILGAKKISDKNLSEALVATEIKIRNWLKENARLYDLTLYVGLAKNMSTRFPGHKSDLKLVQEDTQMCRWSSSRKERIIGSVLKLGYETKMSALVFNIPEKYLPIVEILVGLQFNVLAKGSSKLGDDQSWLEIAKYMKSEARANALHNAGLLNIVEQFDDMLLKAALNISALGH